MVGMKPSICELCEEKYRKHDKKRVYTENGRYKYVYVCDDDDLKSDMSVEFNDGVIVADFEDSVGIGATVMDAAHDLVDSLLEKKAEEEGTSKEDVLSDIFKRHKAEEEEEE